MMAKGIPTRAGPWFIGAGAAALAFVVGLSLKPPSTGVVAILVADGTVSFGAGDLA